MRGKFQATIIVVFVGILALLMSGCGQDDVETTVRKGTLQLDPSVTVEDALQGYQYFRRSSWKTFTDPQGRQIVEFTGPIHYDAFQGTRWMGMEITAEQLAVAKKYFQDTRMEYVAQFAVSKDVKTFNLHFSGLQLSGPHRETGQPIQQHLPDDDYSMIRSVYSNQPLETVWAFLYSAASE